MKLRQDFEEKEVKRKQETGKSELKQEQAPRCQGKC